MSDNEDRRTTNQKKIRYAFSLVRNALRRHPAAHQEAAIEEITRELNELRDELRIARAQAHLQEQPNEYPLWNDQSSTPTQASM